MRLKLNMKKLALVAVLAISAADTVQAQNATDRLRPLVETSARRLVIAEQVALAKWDSGTEVEDVPREAQVIASAMEEGEAKGLDRASTSKFFRAQIEANKLIQYSLLARWRRDGKSPDHLPINLTGTIRPELDQVQAALIAELAETAGIRASASCRTDVARAVGTYVSGHKNFTSLSAIALDRAVAAACTP